MSYILKFQLMDTKREFNTEQARDSAYDSVKAQMLAWGIHEDHIILTKLNNETCHLGYSHETIVSVEG